MVGFFFLISKLSCPILFLTAASSFSHNPGNSAMVAQTQILYLYKAFFKFLRYLWFIFLFRVFLCVSRQVLCAKIILLKQYGIDIYCNLLNCLLNCSICIGRHFSLQLVLHKFTLRPQNEARLFFPDNSLQNHFDL